MTSVHTQHESLSALFDGELPGDAGRFARRRLEHDPDWQGRIERWQLIGDVMRGQAVVPASPGFAAGVSRAIAAQAPSTAAPAAPVTQAPRRRTAMWSGLALAASVAAAVVLVRPLGEGPTARAPAPLASAAPAAVQAPAPVTALAPSTSAAEPVLVAAAPATRAVPRARPAPRRPATARTAAEPVQALAVSAVEPAPVRVFAPPPADDTLVSRPWPRATLPALAAPGAAFNASLGQAPSFYPFEPPADAAPAPPASPP